MPEILATPHSPSFSFPPVMIMNFANGEGLFSGKEEEVYESGEQSMTWQKLKLNFVYIPPRESLYAWGLVFRFKVLFSSVMIL